ncbi:MarR family winged helix-turn-helix transcriptional regulator [Halobacillus sp. BBL2006]|uniref:MarR family winged helix-turn-helix transcriptional regulator n=1 Tax=Halobacillus sp. BBL2006 TaxID=1543706 RepID=UPI000542F58D|nr:MarR family transcriptional regulator [Halobacillus sp. BBL2006]KHE67106.1 MarR family transcriptional regulator [Halobacillus sp. BBL2006]
MSDESLDLIEQQVTDFIRRIVLTEKRHDSLDRSAYILLRQLSSYGPAGVKSLAEELHLDISTVSRQAAALVEKKYVEKIPNPEDGRAYFYQITAIGSQELEENKQRRFDRLARILEDWSEEDKEKFGHLLQKYNQTVNQKMNL